jgi:uncharacterized protein YraI
VIDTATDDALNVRSGPGTDHPVVGTLPADATAVRATGLAALDDQDRTWTHVTHGETTGWVASWYLTANPCTLTAPGGFCVTDTTCTDRLNVRSGPGGGYPKIGSLAHDAVGVAATGATTTDDNDRVWTQVTYRGQNAWVASWFLTPAPCAPSTGEPCECPMAGVRWPPGENPQVGVFVHDVDPVGRIIWFDPIDGYYWEEGWRDGEAYPINDDPTVYRLPIADDFFLAGCGDPTSPVCVSNDPGTYAEYDLDTYAQWIWTDTLMWQSNKWVSHEQVPNANNQWWVVHLIGCSVSMIEATYHP